LQEKTGGFGPPVFLWSWDSVDPVMAIIAADAGRKDKSRGAPIA